MAEEVKRQHTDRPKPPPREELVLEPPVARLPDDEPGSATSKPPLNKAQTDVRHRRRRSRRHRVQSEVQSEAKMSEVAERPPAVQPQTQLDPES